MLDSVEDTVEVISLKGSEKPLPGVTAETSFTNERNSSVKDEGVLLHPVPQPRRRAALDRLKTAEWCTAEDKVKTPRTPRSDSAQRLVPPNQEDGESRQSVSVSSRRQSVSGWSLASVNSQSDSRSYRERIRERIQAVKELAGSSVASTRLRNLRMKSPLVSHFDNILDREENEIEAALEKHEEMRKKWKNAVHASLEAEAAHNFFTKEWEEDKDTEYEGGPSSPKAAAEGVEEASEETEQVKLVTKDYLGLPEEWQAVDCYMEPVVDDITLRIHRENQIYYYPSNSPVSMADRLGPDCTARYLEDEGLYVGPKPVWSAKSCNKLQQRLLMEGRKHWFGEDGELKTFLQDGSDTDPLLAPVYRNGEMMSVCEPEVRRWPPARVLYLLELEVSSVTWSHHPLCGPEHVAARLLLARHQEYSGRVRAGLGCRLASKLQALRTARDNVKRAGDIDGYHRYGRQVKETREMRLEEGRKDRLAVLNCLKAWLELRALRSQQGYTVTPVRLQIVELDGAGDSHSEWDTELKCQVAERIAEEEEEYKRKMEDLDNKGSEEVIMEKVMRKSPAQIVEEVKGRLSECLLPPGEPVVTLELADGPVTPDADISDLREIERRGAQKRCQLSVRVLYNKHEVCRSRPLSLYPHFTSSLNQRFSLQVTDWPQSLALQLDMEGGIGSGKHLTASVFLPVPSENSTLATSTPQELEFSVPDKLGPYPHTGVGCGRGSVMYAGGQVKCRLGWGEHGGPSHNRPHTIRRSRSGRRTTSSLANMREWVSRAHLDPNDPANADLFEYLKTETGKEVNGQSNKGKNSDLPEGDFCTMEEIENNPRLKLLSLRNQVVPEFKDIRNIPMRDREIPDDIFDVYRKRTESLLRAGPDVGETALEWQREWSRQQLELIKDNILQHCRQTQQQTSLRDVVLEDQVPDIGTLGLTFMKWLQPKRPLRPTRKERKKLPVLGLVGQQVEVIVNVVRAFEVPVRMDVDPLLENGISLVPVRPFVEVSFQGRKSRTTTAEGANPTWNQDLRISVQLPSSGLYSVQDSLYCQLYDETVVDLLEDDRQRETNIHQRLERHWLGSLRVPFSSLCDNARIEGTFQLYSPPVLLGYQRESQNRTISAYPPTPPLATATSSLRDSTFLTLFITVHPPLHPPDPFKERLPCSELTHVEQHLEEWRGQVMGQFPHRPVKCLVVDTSARSVCVTRYFQPIPPPVLEEGEPTTAEMALRFVSKIPIVAGSVLFPGLFDVWLTAQQVLSLLSGDCEDHGVLLCCYLTHLGLKAWLLLGSGVPHGSMALVLTRDIPSGTTYTLWDPATGHKFSTQDSFCPLHRVYCLINQDNIWANIQREEVVSRTRFDVTRRADWWPVFNRNVATPVGSVQPATVDYPATAETDVSLLQDKLETLLRDSISRWRPATRTVWNRYVSVKLRKLLPGMEKAAWNNSVSVLPEHLSQLTQTLSSHKMCGFTQNFAFTGTEEIVEAVKATGIHTNESSDVEFALAVYIHPFPCGVLSAWVYVTSLTLRR